MKQLLLFALLMIPVLASAQDLIKLKNGQIIDKCAILKEDSVNVYFEFNRHGKMVTTYTPKDSIESYIYNYAAQRALPDGKIPKVICDYKISKFTKMKRTGTTLGIAGGILMIAGVLLVTNSNWDDKLMGYDESEESGYTQSDENGVIGTVCLIASIPLTTTGIVKRITGAQKTKKFKAMYNNLSLRPICKSQQQGLALMYRF